MANETDPVLIKAVKWLQLRQESLKDGFVVDYKGGEYIFVPEYIDRFGKISKVTDVLFHSDVSNDIQDL